MKNFFLSTPFCVLYTSFTLIGTSFFRLGKVSSMVHENSYWLFDLSLLFLFPINLRDGLFIMSNILDALCLNYFRFNISFDQSILYSVLSAMLEIFFLISCILFLRFSLVVLVHVLKFFIFSFSLSFLHLVLLFVSVFMDSFRIFIHFFFKYLYYTHMRYFKGFWLMPHLYCNSQYLLC